MADDYVVRDNPAELRYEILHEGRARRRDLVSHRAGRGRTCAYGGRTVGGASLEGSERGAVMSEHKPGDEQHRHESALLHDQEHKGYGDDEGEREEILGGGEDEETETAG
jgi:hypothetical protein